MIISAKIAKGKAIQRAYEAIVKEMITAKTAKKAPKTKILTKKPITLEAIFKVKTLNFSWSDRFS